MDGIHGSGGAGSAGSISQQLRHLLQAIRDVRSGKVAPDTPERTQTTLNYKLDMDERGILKSASPGQSIIAVTNQEQMNVNRLSAEAAARGEEVISVDVDYKTQIVDGKLAIVAGHTEVTSKPIGARPKGMGVYEVEQRSSQPAPAAAGGDADYRAIGEANRQAAGSLKHIDLGDDATVRGLSGGLSAEDAEPETVQEIFAEEYRRAEDKRGE